MKTSRHSIEGMVWIIALVLSLCLCFGALAESGTLFPWLTYTLDVSLVTTDPEVVDYKDAPTDGTLVMVKLAATSGAIKTDDIKEHCGEITLRDADGDEYKVYYWRFHGVEFDAAAGTFSTKPEQDGFELLFYLKGKEASALTGAKLLVPTGVAGESIVVPLELAPTEATGEGAPQAEAQDSATGASSFVLGGVTYTISALDDEPSFQMPNQMDGKDGHVVSFTYPGSGEEAEEANDLLYSGARLRQPNGDVVQAYCNSDNIGNPYELYFGLSDDVLLTDCVFTIQSDDGDVEIPLSTIGNVAAVSERDANTFSYTVGGETYELALISVAYNEDEKQIGVEIVLYDHDLLDFVKDKALNMPFGCGIISTKDGFQYVEGITASMSMPMHLTFFFDVKNVPDLVCFGKLNEKNYKASEDFALVDPENNQYVDTFPITALMKHEKSPDELLASPEATPAATEPAATEPTPTEPAPTATVEPLPTEPPTVALSEGASDIERQIVAFLTQCTEGTKDTWQLAIYRAGVRDVAADPENPGAYTFKLRDFNPKLKDLGKYQDENKQGYLARMLENTKAYGLEVTLTMEEGAFTQKSCKALQGVVKKAAASSKKAYQDKQALSAIVDTLFYDDSAIKVKSAADLLTPPADYADWAGARSGVLSSLSAEKWMPFFYAQVKQSLDVSGGPYALALKCTAIDMAKWLEAAKNGALKTMAYMDYDHRWEDGLPEQAFQQALADKALILKKKTKELETRAISLNLDAEPLYGEEYPELLAAFDVEGTLDSLRSLAQDLPDYAAQPFPKAGWLSGSKSGTQVRIKAPKDSGAYYVQLRGYSSDEIVVAGFVQPGSTCTVRVPKGDYYFVMANGTTWYGEEYLFGADTEYTKTGLFQVMSSNYYHTVTLRVTKGGNIPVYGADEGDLR